MQSAFCLHLSCMFSPIFLIKLHVSSFIDMQILLAFVSILAYSWGQLIDQLEYMKVSTIPPNFYPTVGRQGRPPAPSNAQVPVYSLQYPGGYSVQNAIPPPSVPPPPLRGMQPKTSVTTSTGNPLQGWSDHVSTEMLRLLSERC